ncbi:Fe-S cluster assembly protein SufD [Nitrococcus mobilis]|uniref:FeS assembly protein SufD n=1 Tax=Nitrococcus mobilis Nb-231 TaxID=314278 RepID=A4BQ66_9GAMM|nr:Fe-S cluster assembly protein SufD [Nitrococcus mobilis]EAR22221.1 FeS assembly protein SufD [Nitrococcus mobilis Nb-231]
MEAIAEQKSVYLQDYEAHSAHQDAPEWLARLRQHGIECFEAQGFPGRKVEAWRKTDLTPVLREHFVPASGPGQMGPELLEKVGVLGQVHRLVFVDGWFDPGLSDVDKLPNGLTLAPLSEYGERLPAVIQEALGGFVDTETHPFTALNTAFFRDGAIMHVARGATVEQPVVVVHLLTPEADRRAVYPRTVLVAEEASQVTLIEQFVGADEPFALNCPVTEIVARQGANVDYYKVQEEGAGSAHLGAVHAETFRDATVHIHSLACGAKLARTDIYANLIGPGADVTLNGLYLTTGRQYCDHHTWVNHKAEHGTSRQVFKGVLQGRSETVFDGLVKVFERAQKIDAQQQNRNLLLGKLALAHSNPRLEIHADDVKCSHGSTVGKLDDEALFYLNTRGIGLDEAQGLLTFAFAAEMLKPIRLDRLYQYERQLLLQRLPGAELTGEVL